ncbi:MAG: hypothetical protein Q7T77_03125, partial [Sulfuricurvum sp.]|nr:hypothetical protein [Sulfuricurvum sp.]
VNITVGENTNLKGSLIAAGSTDESGVFQDKKVNGEAREAALGHKNLNLSTKTLTFENSTNTNYSSYNSMSAGASYSDTLNKEKNEHKDKTTLTTSFSTGMNYERTKTLATLGQGNINITDKENSDDTDRLNRDTTKVDKSLFKTTTGTSVDATLDTRLLTEKGQEEIRQEVKEAAAGAIGATAFVGNIITGNMDVDNAIKSYQDPYKTAEALRNNPELAATLDAFTKGEFDNLPKTKEALQTLANATGLNVDVLLTTITSYENAKGTTDQNLVALDVNKENRPDTLATLGHEENHARGGTNETLADMSGYATQLLSEVAIGSHDTATLNAIQFEMGAGKDTQTQMANQVFY